MIVYPTKVNLSFDTVPSGRTIYLDGIAKITPFVYDTLVGYNHTVEARNQIAGNTSYTFASWSDGGGQQHSITVPTRRRPTRRPSIRPPSRPAWSGAWALNEGAGAMASDASGSGNHGTVAGAGATWTASGKYGSALSFDGSSGNVTVPSAPSLSFNSSYTLEAWVRPTALSGYQTVLIKETTGGCAYWLQTTGNDDRAAGSRTAAVASTSEHYAAVPVNQWSHLAAVFNDGANTYTLYLNGTPISTQSETVAPVANSQALVFGQSACGGCGYERWRGLLDEIRIYNRPLSTAEVQADMNTGI